MLGQLSEDQGNVAQLEWTIEMITIRERRPWKQLFLEPTCQCFGFHPGCHLHIELFVVRARGHEAELHAGNRHLRLSLRLDRQRFIGRLNVFGRLKEPIKNIVDDAKHCLVAAEIRHEGIDHPTANSNLLHDSLKGFDVSSAKSVDRLFGISHNK